MLKVYKPENSLWNNDTLTDDGPNTVLLPVMVRARAEGLLSTN